MTLQIIQKRTYTYALSFLLVALSIAALFLWGLRTGIDFEGGTSIEVHFSESVEIDAVKQNLEALDLISLQVQSTGEGAIVIEYLTSDEDQNSAVREAISALDENMQILDTQFVGSVISGEMRSRSVQAVVVAIIAIALYIAWAFRKVSQPVPSWVYGAGAIVALAHDVIITLGVFSVLGRWHGVEIDVPFIAALLTILGYSVNDTIVVYDRTRENLLRFGRKKNFETIVNMSLNETLMRSINTSVTIVFVLVAIIALGSSSLTYFSLALLIGVIIGTYSSIFIASALLVTFYRNKK